MHSWIILTFVNVEHSGPALTVEHIHTLVIAISSVKRNVSAPMQPTVSHVYLILIRIATILVFATNTGAEMTVAYVSTWKLATQFAINAMAVEAQLPRTVLSVTLTLSATSKDTVNV